MSGRPDMQMALPQLEPWHRWLLGGLLGAFVLELLLANFELPVYFLAWLNLGDGFAPWQPLTRFLVQGSSRAAVSSVLMSLVLLYFLLPPTESAVGRRQLGLAVLAGAVGGTALPLLTDALGWTVPAPALGWGPLVLVLPVLFGLHRPDADVYLVIFPIKARWFVWGGLVVALLMLLAERSLSGWEELGVWLGTVGYYHLLGPGRRKRELRAKAAGIERELSRFQVLEGGRGKPQGRQRDDTVH